MDQIKDFLVDYPWIGLPLIGIGLLVQAFGAGGLGWVLILVGGAVVYLHQYAASWLIKQQRTSRPKV